MKQFAGFLLAAFIFFSCGQKAVKNKVPLQVPISTAVQIMLDSISKISDTIYTKPYKRTDFVLATHYADTVDKTVCQVMKDSSQQIRQIIVSKKNTRTFFAQYYPNGQIIDSLSLDELGQYHGHSISYYESGQKKSEGNYLHGFRTGKWNNYDESGKLVSTDEYDVNGARINQ